MDGDWSLARVKVTDGQLKEHIIEDVNGVLNLNFNAGTSDGFSIFDLNKSFQVYQIPYPFNFVPLQFPNKILGAGEPLGNLIKPIDFFLPRIRIIQMFSFAHKRKHG